MRKFIIAAIAGILIGLTGSAFAVVGTSTITVTDGQSEIPNATVKITFKTETGKRISTVTRRTPRSGKVTVKIPDKTTSIEITAVAPSCRPGQETTSGGLFGWNVSLALRCQGRGRSFVPTSRLDEGAGDGD